MIGREFKSWNVEKKKGKSDVEGMLIGGQVDSCDSPMNIECSELGDVDFLLL